MYNKWALIPAAKPPIVWDKIDFPVISGYFNTDIIATCVDKYPLKHIHIAVNTAMSFPLAKPFDTRLGIKPIAAPAAPKAVIGTAIHWALVNPNKGFKIKYIERS